MWAKVCDWLEAHGHCRYIMRGPDENLELYLKRHYLVKTPWFGLYLHRFYLSDLDDPHDHPWDNISIPLTPFRETVYEGPWLHMTDKWDRKERFIRKFPGFFFRKAEAIHVISLIPGMEGETYSLFAHFRQRRGWGFWISGKWIDHERYGEEVLGRPVETPGKQFKIVGWFLPKVVRLA